MMDRQIADSEHALDRLLDQLKPPMPSDTLRARLKRDFATLPTGRGAGPMGSGPLAALRAPAVAAVLVLAVALGIQYSPQSLTQPSDRVAAPIAVPVTLAAIPFDDTEDEPTDSLALVDDGPDTGRITLALVSGGINYDGPALDSTEPLDGLPLY